MTTNIALTDILLTVLVLIMLALACWVRWHWLTWMYRPLQDGEWLCACHDEPMPSSRGWSTANGHAIWRCPSCRGVMRDDQLKAVARSLW